MCDNIKMGISTAIFFIAGGIEVIDDNLLVKMAMILVMVGSTVIAVMVCNDAMRK